MPLTPRIVVLGGLTIRGSQYSTLAACPCGVYGVYSFNEFSDSPIQTGNSGIFIKTKENNFFSYTIIDVQANRVFVMFSNDGVWNETTPPSFYKNYSTLAALGTSLGVISSLTQYVSGNYSDVNSFINGMTVITHDNKNTIQNNPFTGEVSVVITIVPDNVSSTNSKLQIAYRESTIKYRIQWAGTWGTWTTLATS